MGLWVVGVGGFSGGLGKFLGGFGGFLREFREFGGAPRGKVSTGSLNVAESFGGSERQSEGSLTQQGRGFKGLMVAGEGGWERGGRGEGGRGERGGAGIRELKSCTTLILQPGCPQRDLVDNVILNHVASRDSWFIEDASGDHRRALLFLRSLAKELTFVEIPPM